MAGQTFGTATTEPAFNFLRIEESLSMAHIRLAGTYVENLPWQDCMKRYDRAHTLFYMDPPYWQVEGYGVPFGFEEYEEMAEAMGTPVGTAKTRVRLANVFLSNALAEKGIATHDLEDDS